MQPSCLPVVPCLSLFAFLVAAIFNLIGVIFMAKRRETRMSTRLKELIEATQQSQDKSTALTNASHDIRACLACISALIEISYHEAAPMPELLNKLKQMENCTSDLLGLLNSILDMSKIEAGKMKLEEDDIDLAQLIEDVVDMFHPVAMKKNVDVILDLTDGSILKHSNVKGDRGKLKQILSNLLSNAVKFTSEGEIMVRARAMEPKPEEDQTFPSVTNNLKKSAWWPFGIGAGSKDDEEVNELLRNPNSLEFVFEVSDTGRGIPKDKWNSVFENYVQVKGTSQGQGGTGLGLGIVRSLVRLMGGDIMIVDKENEESGTCFRFNIKLVVLTQQCPSMRLPCSSSSGRSSLVILLMLNEERRRASKSFMDRLGVEVWAVKECIELPSILRKARRYVNLPYRSSSIESDRSSHDDSLIETVQKQFVLLIIDMSFGPIIELLKVLSEFRRELLIKSAIRCKVVWLDKSSGQYKRLIMEHSEFDHTVDVIISKPFHGMCLNEVMNLLPEFGGSTTEKIEKRSCGQDLDVEEDGISIAKAEEDPGAEAKLLSGRRVLVVDDAPILQQVAKQICVHLGAIVDICADGGEAVAIVSSRLNEMSKLGGSSALPYNFILMDCEMPVLNGYNATQRIRHEEKEYKVRIPIFAVTAHAEGPEVKQAFDAGMDSYIQKPLKKEKIIAVLRDLSII